MEKIISWNVNGFRAILNKNFEESIRSLSPDVICLQEIKMFKEQLPEKYNNNDYFNSYYQYWNSAQKKGYSGVSIFSKKEPIDVIYGMNVEEFDIEGRVLTLEFENYYLITAYFPNSQKDLVRLDYKMEFNKCFLSFIQNLNKKKNVIFCGDVNVAHQEIDIKNPKQNAMSPGFYIDERNWFSSLLDAGYIDVFRKQNPNKIAYSWWSYRANSRQRDIGWRLDYFICNTAFFEHVSRQEILKEIEGSDHCPVMLTLK